MQEEIGVGGGLWGGGVFFEWQVLQNMQDACSTR